MRHFATALIAGACALACAACSSQPSNPAVAASTTTYPIGATNGKTFDRVVRDRTATRAWMARDAGAKGGLLYVANLGTNAVDIFTKSGENQQPVGTITSGINFPGGMTVDDAGNLYVVNERLSGSQYSIPMYAKGSVTPSKVFSTDLSSPTDIAVARDGTIYITNFNELSNGWVSVYPKGNPKKEYRLTGFDGGAPLSVALDKTGNVYVMYDTNDTGGSGVSEFAPGAKTGTDLGLVVRWGGGIQVDPSGNIVVVQQLQPPEILEFAPGQTTASKTFQLPDQDQSFDFALNRTGTQMFADDQTVNSLLDLKLPKGKVLRTVAGGFEEPTGVALSPPEF
jgi:sugar lactone lactonase YvrE